MQLQCRSSSTCAVGFSIAKRVKIIVEGRTFYISFIQVNLINLILQALILNKLMIVIHLDSPAEKQHPVLKKIGKGIRSQNLNKKQRPVLGN